VRGHLLISHARGFIFIFYGALAWRHLLSFGERGLFGPPLTLRRPRRRSTVYSYADKLKVPGKKRLIIAFVIAFARAVLAVLHICKCK